MNRCPQCGAGLLVDAHRCPGCGAAVNDLSTFPSDRDVSGADADTASASAFPPTTMDPLAKSRVIYIILGAVLGFVWFPGIHNLYAGYTRNGLIQLIGTWLSCGILWLPMYIWTIVEICTISHDGDGRRMLN